MGKKMTKDEYVDLIHQTFPNVEMIGDYINSTTDTNFKCSIDKHKWITTPIKARQYGCPVCSGYIVTKEKYEQELYEIHGDNIILTGDFKGKTFKTKHHCNKHNFDFFPYPYALLRGQGCKYCAKEKLKKHFTIPQEDAEKRLFEKCGDEYKLFGEYNGFSDKNVFIHNMANGENHTFVATFNQLIFGESCGVCANKQVLPGYNDIATTNPYVASLFTNEEETHQYVELSNKRTNFTCPCCSNIVNQVIAKVSKSGDVGCSHCSDGISYPNKLIYNSLIQIKDKLDFLEREYKPNWCKFSYKGKSKYGIYDIYFGYKGQEYLIEMDGGFHTNPSFVGKTIEEVQFIDKKKDELAYENNKDIIRIDCFYPKIECRFEYIKENIIGSKLNSILDLSIIDFDKANRLSLQSLLLTACDLWNKGLTVSAISLQIGVNPGTARSYLVSGTKYNLCQYNKTENKIRANMTRAVVCLNTKEEFDAILYGAKKYDIAQQTVQKCCNDICAFAGRLNGHRLVWAYKEDYIKMSDTDIVDKLLKAYEKKIVCIEKKLLFLTKEDAGKYINVSGSAIQKCCIGQSKSSGIDKETNTPLHWCYYDNYIQENDKSTLSLYGGEGTLFM